MQNGAAEFSRQVTEQYGIDIDIYEFPEGTKTSKAAAEAIGCSPAQIASSLVFYCDTGPLLVITSGANRVSEKRLAEIQQAETVRLATPDEVKQVTGWSVGGVPPMCHATDIPVLFDETLCEFDTVWAAAGTPTTVFPVAPPILVKLTEATVMSIED